MAETKNTVKPMNVYSKLTRARRLFIEKGVEKSGKNMGLAFKYFELEDIIPTATAIFDELGLCAVVNFIDEVVNESILPYAELTLINCDDPAQTITFRSPMRFVETNKGTNPIQSLGASITYLRRYLYMLCLDVCEADSVDSEGDKGKDAPEQKKPENKAEKPVTIKDNKPVTAEQRAEAKAEVTKTENPADNLQIKKIKDLLNALRAYDEKNEEFAKQVQTSSENFTNLTKETATKLIGNLKEMLKQYKDGAKK